MARYPLSHSPTKTTEHPFKGVYTRTVFDPGELPCVTVNAGYFMDAGHFHYMLAVWDAAGSRPALAGTVGRTYSYSASEAELDGDWELVAGRGITHKGALVGRLARADWGNWEDQPGWKLDELARKIVNALNFKGTKG